MTIETHIPPVLFQFWDKSELPEDIKPKVQSWAEKSGLETRLFDEQSAYDFIQDIYGSSYALNYRKCALPAMKSDFFRILVVYHFGGWYADCSIECLKSPVDLIGGNERDILYYRRWHGGVNNGFFAAKAQSSYLEKILKIVVENLENEKGKTVWDVTGPKAWNDVFKRDISLTDALEIPHEVIAGQYVQFHHDLKHKKDGKHWSDAQKITSIFHT